MQRPVNQGIESRPYAEALQQADNDVWRRTMGLNLRSEGAKFILAAFNLDAFSGQGPGTLRPGGAERHFAERFCRFLGSEPEAHFAMEHGRFISLRVSKSITDVSLCEYGPDGELQRIVPIFDARQPVADDAPETAEAIRRVIGAFNQSRKMPEFARPRLLANRISRIGSAAARRIGSRILASTPVSFHQGPVPPDHRFRPPDFLLHRGFGVGYMAARCRLSPDGRGVDLWLQCHHAGADGGPIQELLERMETCWGVTAPLVLPADDKASGTLTIYTHAGERSAGLLTDFVDFAPLVQLRRELALRLAPQVEAVPLIGLFLWCLSHQPEFAGVGMNTAVDVPPAADQPRAVDLVAVWPHRYHGHPDGFVRFLRDLLTQFADARLRKTRTWKAMTQLTSVPPAVGWAILRFLPGITRKNFGTLTVSMVRDAKAIAPPMPDAAWDHGFMAVGKLGVASESGPSVTPLSVKGDPGRIRSYPAAVRRAIAEGRRYVQ
jgi:hypothetical protein